MSSTMRRLAIVDDDDDLLHELADHFSATYAVDTYRGDPGVLKSLRENPPDVVLVDIALPRLDGFEVLKLASTAPELRETAMIVLSAVNDFASFEKAHRLGALEFLHKPFQPRDLGARLEKALAARSHRNVGRLKLGALLVSSGVLTQEHLERGLARQKAGGGRLGEVLVREGLVTEEAMVGALAGQMRLGVVDLATEGPSPSALGFLSRDFVIRHRVMPLRLDDAGALVLAMTNPLDVVTIDEVGLRLKRRVQPVVCSESSFDAATDIYYSLRGRLQEARDEAQTGDETVVDESIVEIVDGLISDASAMNASDIHLEPRGDVLHVRCRIDGVLHDLREYPAELQAGILSRLKIMANMDIAERRLPQDGRTSFATSDNETVDLRLATIPSLYGENVTLRILEVAPLPPTLGSLGLAGDTLARFERAIKISEGGVLICGPTGSGKSTTLYTALELIKSPER
jgi:type IV pilus assembly protein PilB